MASSKEYLNYILEQLSETDGITYKKMMGEYLLYYYGLLFGGIYDDRFLIKPTKKALDSLEIHIFEKPYDGAKDMLLVENVDDKNYLSELIKTICE